MKNFSNDKGRSKKYWKRDKGNANRKSTMAMLNQLDVEPSKQRGQNFVVNDLVISSIVEFGNPTNSEFLVEIGPGLGALTKPLYSVGLREVIEIEGAFVEQLKKQMPELNVTVADAREFNWLSYSKPVTVFTNLPYSISSEILLKFCEYDSSIIKRIVLLLQKEFAQRLAAPVGAKDYGILSVFTQKAATTQLGPIIGAENFFPKPKIDSQVIELKFRDKQISGEKSYDSQFYRKVVRAAFAKRRKMILNSLLSVGLATEEVLRAALEHAGISATCRAQELSYIDFERLAASLHNNRS